MQGRTLPVAALCLVRAPRPVVCETLLKLFAQRSRHTATTAETPLESLDLPTRPQQAHRRLVYHLLVTHSEWSLVCYGASPSPGIWGDGDDNGVLVQLAKAEGLAVA